MNRIFVRFNLNTTVAWTRFITFEDDSDTVVTKDILETKSRIDMGDNDKLFCLPKE